MFKLPQPVFAERWALVPLRLMVGFGFAFHGYAKIARGMSSFSAVVDALGLPWPVASAWATSWLELLGGIGLMLGVFEAALSLPLAVTMLTAMFGVHLRYGFSSIKLLVLTPAGAQFGPPGYELNLLYLAALLCLAMSAPSPYSLSRWLRSRRSTLGGARERAKVIAAPAAPRWIRARSSPHTPCTPAGARTDRTPRTSDGS